MLNNISKNIWISIFICLLIFALNLIIINLPLLNILSYESTIINAVTLSLFSGLYWLYFYKSKSIKSIISQLLLFFTIPLFILLISTVLCQKCPIDDGIYFYLLFVIPSISVSIAIASISNDYTKRFKYILYLFLWVIILFSFLPELYFNPQIYFFNPIFGYYPGVIYDQNIEISQNIILYQLSNLIISVIITYLLYYQKNFGKRAKHFVIYGVIVLFISSYFIKPKLQLSTDLNRIKSELREEIITEHFNIIIPDTLSVEQKKVLEFEHEYYYQSIANLLETKLESKITSIIFDPGAQKKRLFGSENADVAKPWLNQIYINLDNYENSLKHEISHIFSANFSHGLFKVPLDFNPGMIEGFAMAVENDYANLDIDYMAALAYKNNYDVSLSDLFSNFSFFANASSLSYIYAGSFFKFLAKKYGWQKCNKFYSGGEFEEIFGSNIEDIENEYNIYLDELEVENNEHIANYYFSRKPLLKLNCARSTAKQMREAKVLFEQKEYKDASKKYLEIYDYSKTYSAFVGFIQSKLFLEEKDDAINKLSNEMVKFEGTGSYYYLEFLLADLYALNNDSISAVNLYDSIIGQNPHPIYLRSAKVKKELLSLGDSILINYMLKNDSKVEKIIELFEISPNDYLLQTLCVLIENEKGKYEDMIETIENSTKSIKYSTETYFQLSKLAYKNLDFITALNFGNLAYNNSNFKNRAIIEDHVKKIKWISNSNLLKN